MASPIAVAEDRTLRVPRDHTVKTAWIPMARVRFACSDRMAVGDVDRSYRVLLQLRHGDDLPDGTWPPPRGYWDGETFVLEDGRHEKLGRELFVDEEIFVAWLHCPDGGCERCQRT